MGYDGTGTTVPCGFYTVGEVESRGGGDGDVTVFHAGSASTSKELRTERSQAFEKMRLAAIIFKGADRHRFNASGYTTAINIKAL